MISLWMLYAIAISTLFGLAALLLEKVLLWYRRPARWVWGAAMTASILLPVVFFLMPPAPAASSPEVDAGIAHEEVGVGIGALGMLPDPTGYMTWRAGEWMKFDGAVLPVWLATTSLLFLVLALSIQSLRTRRERWRRDVIEGRDVFMSPDLGPAVVGLRRPAIVLPEWVLELETRALDLILAHEEEHVAARDTILLCGALLLLVLAPWNLPLWWHYRRLRLAVECDCDRRVLGRGVRWNEYGALLVTVGARARRVGLPAAALAESSTLLERRLIMMNTIIPSHRRGKTLVALGAGIFLIALACEAPLPTVDDDGQPLVPEESAASAEAGTSDDPAFIPHTVSPTVANREDVEAALIREYPDALRQAGIGGTVLMHFYVNEEGRVQNTVIDQSSGHTVLDQAAFRVAEAFRFSPAFNRDQATAVWVSIPIRFTPAGEAPPPPTPTEATSERRPYRAPDDLPPPPPTGDVADAPAFVPHTASPSVRNRQDVERALIREYPDALREAGIGGTVLMHFFVSADGTLENTVIQESSGHQVLDEAAYRVAETFEFNPALNGNERVAVWVSIPIRFTIPSASGGDGDAASIQLSGVRGELRGMTLTGDQVQVRGSRMTGNGIRLSGTGSIDPAKQPLYIVDGVIITSRSASGPTFDEVDIESIEVLDGIEAQRLYGSRAANGLVLISTRRESVDS